jgi:hypothetical protein
MEHTWDEEEEDEEEEEELLAWDGEGHVHNDEMGDGEGRGNAQNAEELVKQLLGALGVP